MGGTQIARHYVIDNFLPAKLAGELLGYAADSARLWRPTQLRETRGGETIDDRIRHSEWAKGGLGSFEPAFSAAIEARSAELCRETGSQPLPPGSADLELELVAHRSGGFYARHVDTFTDPMQGDVRGVRVVSAVYYLHLQPKGFIGGELALHPFRGDGPPELIEPRHNRLVAFPSIAPHEVLPVQADAAEAARFSINCWLRRPLSGGQ